MRRFLLAILGTAAVVVLMLAETVFFPRPRAWVLWVGQAHADPFVHWVGALRAYGWRFDCEAARPARTKDLEDWVFECFPSETQPWSGR